VGGRALACSRLALKLFSTKTAHPMAVRALAWPVPKNRHSSRASFTSMMIIRHIDTHGGTAMPKTVAVRARIDAALDADIAKLAELLNRPKSWIIERAREAYLAAL